MFIRDFVRDRNEALFSMDKQKIVAFLHKYEIPIPGNETVFWAGVHKAILNITSATPEQKETSRRWLLGHGFTINL